MLTLPKQLFQVRVFFTWILVSLVTDLCLQSSCWEGGLWLFALMPLFSKFDSLCSVSLPWVTLLSAIVAFHGHPHFICYNCLFVH